MSLTTADGEQRVFLGDVRWETFQALLHDVVGEHRGRWAYDQGLLEIMSPSYDHESIKALLGRCIETVAEELAIPIRAAGSTTLQRLDQRRAVEADESFYVGDHARGSRQPKLDLRRDPPPDLVVEVDISRSSRARLSIYAAMGVPEVWQWIGDHLSVLRLQPSGEYLAADASQIFPMLPLAGLEPLLRRRHEVDDTQLVREFRAWLKTVLGRKGSKS
ncbi:MAG: Uma2 family endonuclease [Planctomycetota bacterium]